MPFGKEYFHDHCQDYNECTSEKQKEFTQTLLSMIEPTGKEAGCLGYAVFADIEDKNRFNLLEEWATREDMDQHIRSHRFGVLLGTKTLLCEPPKIQIYTVSNRKEWRPFMQLEGKAADSSPMIAKSLH